MDDAGAHPDVSRLQAPAEQARLAAARWPAAAVMVCAPAREEGGFACFDGFLGPVTLTGEPLGYGSRGAPALSQLAGLLVAAGWPERGEGEGGVEAGGNRGGPASPALPRALDLPDPVAHPHIWPPTRLVGFSKGGVVLNQALADLVAVAEGREGGNDRPAVTALAQASRGLGGSGAVPRPTHPARPPTPRPPLSKPCGTPAPQSIDRLVYVDAGLNCRGAYECPPGVRALAGTVAVELHGTPRQWGEVCGWWLRGWWACAGGRGRCAAVGAAAALKEAPHPSHPRLPFAADRRRPWLAAERDRMVAALREAGVAVDVLPHFSGTPPGLAMHFRCLEAALGEPGG